MKKSRILHNLLFPVLIWTALFCLLQVFFKYNFYTIEETNLFLFDSSWLYDKFARIGGGTLVLSHFFIQFFVLPYAGAAIVAAVLTMVALQLAGILRKQTSGFYLLLCMLPVVSLLLSQLDIVYKLQGTIAISIMLAAFRGYLYPDTLRGRLVYAIIAVPLIYFLAGAVSVLFGASILLYEILNRPKSCYWSLIPASEALAISAASVYFACVGELRFALLPDMYYHPLITSPPHTIYYVWIAVLTVIFLGWLAGKRKAVSLKRTCIENVLQLALLVFIGYHGIVRYGDLRFMKFREINYYARQENWDKVISLCGGNINNYLYLMNLNMALAHKGVLADKMFHFNQKGVEGLYPAWNNDYPVAVLLSDYHFTVGNTAGALHFAFEGNVASNNESPRMIKRLIQSYLIYGNYPVAERYIRMMEKTLFYKGRAKEYRKFLDNDAAVEADPVLGEKRKLIPERNFLYNTESDEYVLAEIARRHPSAKPAIEYLGAVYLLSRDIRMFEHFLQQFYGTDTSPVLPLSFQEAVLVLYEAHPEMWKKYKVSNDIITRFHSYKNDFIAARSNKTMLGSMQKRYGNTYWYYYMFTK